MRLAISAFGRPAPQGSHELGGAGQLLDSSRYLASWRAAVRIAAFRAYADAGILPGALPLIPAPAPVTIERCTFYMLPEQCRAADTDEPTGKPDIDKLLRGVLDALGGAEKSARVFTDDSQVVEVQQLSKVRMTSGRSGAFIIVSDGRD